MLNGPLEQFQLLSFIPLQIFNLDFDVTNFLIISLLAFFCFDRFIYHNGFRPGHSKKSLACFIPHSGQKIIESLSKMIIQLISDTIEPPREKYFPIISILFTYILFSNLIGLISYSFTTTSHLVITFTLSFSVFVGINIITFNKYNIQIFSLFLPANTTFVLALLLVPIETISYIAKPISLGVRLFINLMAGHSLLKVIIGFSWGMLLIENSISMLLIMPMVILVILFCLELGVAFIQTYVFAILTCIYIQDGS